jgi:hypothetical protein
VQLSGDVERGSDDLIRLGVEGSYRDRPADKNYVRQYKD